MVFALSFLGNAAANFLFGLLLSGMLGPAEYGRYATAALGASVVAILAFDWLRLSTYRFTLALGDARRTASSLELGFLVMSLACLALGGLAAFFHFDFGLGSRLALMTFVLAIANARFDYRGARLRSQDEPIAFARLSMARQGLLFTFVFAIAWYSRSAIAAIAALALSQALASLSARIGRGGEAPLEKANFSDIKAFVRYSAPIVTATALFMAIGLVNREIAMVRFGAAETGKLALATDLSFRLFMVFNFLPETVLFQIAMRREAREGVAAASRQIRFNQVIALSLIAPVAIGYMIMAPTFEALIVPKAYRGEFALLSRDLAPGFLAYCAVYAICNPVFQLARRTWPAALAALGAFALNLALAFSPIFSHDIEGLALAHSASLIFAFAVAAIVAMRQRGARPRWRDLSAIAASTALMALAIRPLNAIHSAPLAATLAVLGGGALFTTLLFAFDVAGVRAQTLARLRDGTPVSLTAR
jgi:O-antigen/teichoic acid export membrane protein